MGGAVLSVQFGTVSQSYSETTMMLLIIQSTNLKTGISGDDVNFPLLVFVFLNSFYAKSFRFLWFQTHC